MKTDFLIFLDFIKKLYRDKYLLWMLTMRELKLADIGSIFFLQRGLML